MPYEIKKLKLHDNGCLFIWEFNHWDSIRFSVMEDPGEDQSNDVMAETFLNEEEIKKLIEMLTEEINKRNKK